MPYSFNDAQSRLNEFARTRTKAGRDLNEVEWGELGKRAQARGWSGGEVSDDLYAWAENEIGSHFGQLNPSPQPAAPPPSGPGMPSPRPDNYAATPREWMGGTPAPTGGGDSFWLGSGQNPTLPVRGRDGVPSMAPGGPGGSGAPPTWLDDLLKRIFPDPKPNPMDALINEQLQQLIARGSQPVDITDPQLAPAAASFRNARRREQQHAQDQSAESLATQGLLRSGAMDSEVRRGREASGRDIAGYESSLVLNEMGARRQQMMQALQLAMQSGQFDRAQELQRQLAQLDAQLQNRAMTLDHGLRGEALNLQRTLGLGDLDLRNRGLGLQGLLGRGDLGLRLLQSLMQHDQFYSSLGLNAAQLQALLNQAAMNQLFNGF